MLGPPPTRLEMEVELSPPRVRERLRTSMGTVRSLLLSPTWGRREPFVGRIEEARFRMRVRHDYSNGLTRLLSGRVLPWGSGSRIEVEFRTLGFVIALLRAAWIGILVLAAPFVLDVSTRFAQDGGGAAPSEVVLPLLEPVGMLALLIGIEAIARRMGDRDEQRMREHLAALFEDVRVRSDASRA